MFQVSSYSFMEWNLASPTWLCVLASDGFVLSVFQTDKSGACCEQSSLSNRPKVLPCTASLQTHKHTNTQTHKHTNTQTHKHTNTWPQNTSIPNHEHPTIQTHTNSNTSKHKQYATKKRHHTVYTDKTRIIHTQRSQHEQQQHTQTPRSGVQRCFRSVQRLCLLDDHVK